MSADVAQFARWVYIGVFDMAIEVGLFVTSIHLIWNRYILLSARLAIVGAFACRLPYVTPLYMLQHDRLTIPVTSRSPFCAWSFST